jgi:aldehyde:ferredoxin oxidoreductase
VSRFGGWTGKTLRVNLSSGRIGAEDTIASYKDCLGGTGMGYKVLWDEVPEKTGSYDEANKVVLAGGPLTGTGAPCGGRTSITTIFPTVFPTELVASGHMGGNWGAELKYAGWDAVIVEGRSERPVYIAIEDERVEIRDASHLWGNGIYRATHAICQEMGPETEVAAIGQAGENMVRLSVVMTGFSHSAGGVGSVLGCKKLKAIAVRGTGSVRIAGDRKAWKELNGSILSFLGANNQHVVPSTPQPWAEYWAPDSRWTARKGLYWGAASPPIETGECRPEDLGRLAYRTQKATFDLGPGAEKHTVRMGGCHSCPIRCHAHLDVPAVEAKYGVSRYAANTCTGWQGRSFFRSFPDGARGQTSIEAAALAKHLADDYGVWCNYGAFQRDFRWAYYNGVMKANVPEKEFVSIPWDKYEKGDPEFLKEIYSRVAFREGELGTALGEGSGRLAVRWKFPAEYFTDRSVGWWKQGHPRHHAAEDAGQTGVLINLMYNRDAQCHSHSNFTRNGLPIHVQKAIAARLWGADAVDARDHCTPMNAAKARFAAWAVFRKELHDSLTLCNWMWPLTASPLRSRNYEGDTTLEAQVYSLVTGDMKDAAELDLVAERIFNLHRALTIRDMDTLDMRTAHDTVPEWVFTDPEGREPFTPGTYRMDRSDIERGKDMLYDVLGWDRKTGAPTRSTLERLGLAQVADRLSTLGLLPSEADKTPGQREVSPSPVRVTPCEQVAVGACAASGDAAGIIAHTVRYESATYPRPTRLETFCEAPFSIRREEVEHAVASMRRDPRFADIRAVRASDGSVFLFSSSTMEEAHARSLAEWQAVGQHEHP